MASPVEFSIVPHTMTVTELLRTNEEPISRFVLGSYWRTASDAQPHYPPRSVDR